VRNAAYLIRHFSTVQNKKIGTLLANSSQRKQNNITPVCGLLLMELPSEGAVQQEGD
jgi:hypothetical protein